MLIIWRITRRLRIGVHEMKTILKAISYAALLATVLPSVLVFAGTIELDTHKWIMVIGMVVWFVTAPFSIKEKGVS